jgi:ketosteroid isomerase-like protein
MAMTSILAVSLAMCLQYPLPPDTIGVRSEIPSTEIAGRSVTAPEQVVDSAAVMAVVRGFKGALAAGDSTKVLSYLHDDLSVFEGRQAENLAQYRSGHLAADIAHLKTVTQTVTKESFRISGDMAYYTSLYSSVGTSRGREVNSNGTETMVLARTSAGWKVLHVHW